MRFPRKRGSTSVMVRVFIPDNTSAIGAGLTGLTNASTNLTISAIRELSGAAVSYTGANLEAQTTIGTYEAPSSSSKCRFKAVDATNFPGLYEIHFHNDAAIFTTADTSQNVVINVYEATTTALNIGPNMVMIPLSALTVLDGEADMVRYKGNTVPDADTAGYPKVTLKSGTGTGEISLSGGVAQADVAKQRGVTAPKTKYASTTGNWGTAGTWSDAAVPEAGDNIVIQNGVTVTVAANLDLGIFGTQRLEGTGRLNIGYGKIVARVNPGWIISNNEGTVTTNWGTVTDNFITVTTNWGTVTINWGPGTVTTNWGTVTNNRLAGTVSTNWGTVTINNDSTVTTNYGTVTNNNGTVTTNVAGGVVFGGTVTTNNGNHFRHQTGDCFTNVDKLRFTDQDRVLAHSQPGGIGQGDDSFQFHLTSESAEPKVLEPESGNISDEQFLDATKRTESFTGATIGTQWKITVNVDQHEPDGNRPWVELSSSDTDVATVDSQGHVEYVGDGTCEIIGRSNATEFSPARDKRVTITNTTSGGQTTSTVTYIPDALDPAKHILILYNADSADSTALKNYLLANRPGYATANVLGLTGLPDATSTTSSNVTNLILNPVYDWLVANEASKPIRYIIGLRGVPSRQGSSGSVLYMLYDLLNARDYRTGEGYKGGASRFCRAQYQGASCLPSWIDCGSYAATTAYIDKIAAAAVTGLQPDGVTVSGLAVAGDQWAFDEKRGGAPYSYPSQYNNDQTQVIAEGIDAGDVNYQSSKDGPQITAIADPAWMGDWGVYKSSVLHTIVSLSGKAGWWGAQMVQSYGGIYGDSHIDPTEAFAATAWGGADYSNTPVAFVGYTAEPYLSGVQTQHYPGRWARGWTIAEAAWIGRNTQHILLVADPLVTR